MTLTAAHPTLVDLVWSASDRSRRRARNVALVLAGSALLAVAAKVQIPFAPVPMTMQDFAVLLLGMALGWRLGAAAVLCYLAQGALGLPVFASTPPLPAGLAYLAGPTGGYLAGFVAAAALCGLFAERGWDRRPATTAAAMALGIAAIFLCGLAWLSRYVGASEALHVGLYPFLPAAAFKIALATWLLPAARRAAGARRTQRMMPGRGRGRTSSGPHS